MTASDWLAFVYFCILGTICAYGAVFEANRGNAVRTLSWVCIIVSCMCFACGVFILQYKLGYL